MVPRIPVSHWEHTAGSASCSAMKYQEAWGDMLGNGREVAVVVAFTLSNCQF